VTQIIIFLILFIQTALASDLKICEAYQSKASSLHCSKDNYLIEFGYRYCRAYILREKDFRAETQNILSKIRNCLIKDVQSDRSLNCENAEKQAMQSHYDCYLQSGFCDIDAVDKFLIFRVARREFDRPSFRQTMLDIGKACNTYRN
jgi:hypothetical protein